MATSNIITDQDQAQDAVTVSTTPNTSDALGVSTETVVFAVTKSLKNPAAALGFSEYKEGNALYKQVNPEEGKEKETEILHQITVTYPVAHSLAGIQEIMGTEEDEAVNIFNTGAYNKLKSQVRAKFVAVNDAGDLTNTEPEITADEAKDIIASPLKRRSLSDTQKAVRDLKGYSADTLMAALRELNMI